jgi:SsrA-binding protein
MVQFTFMPSPCQAHFRPFQVDKIGSPNTPNVRLRRFRVLPGSLRQVILIVMEERILCQNKKAYHNYVIEEKYEAGMVLQGTEVKSLRAGKAQLKDSYVQIENEEAFLHNTHISPYPYGHQFNHDPERVRKLLLHKREIRRLMGKISQQGYTLVPLKIYLKNGKIKIEIGLGKGKTRFDKREDLKRRSAQREMEKALKVVR